MASELEPCPFCGSNFKIGREPHDNDPVAGMFYIFHEYGPIGSEARKCKLDIQCHFNTEEEAVAFWNTRPAPAATDTGLVTVEHQYWRDQTQEWLPTGFPDRYRKDGFLVRELVTRSQAAELLAAERAKTEMALEQRNMAIVELARLEADNAAKDAQIAGWTESGKLWTAEIRELQAENAAQAARIKELNANTDTLMAECHRVSKESGDQFREMRGHIEALEAKLAAATETAARAAYRACAETRHVSLGHAAADAVRAVLGGKPS